MKDEASTSQRQVSHWASAYLLMGHSGTCEVKALAGCLSCQKAVLERGSFMRFKGP